MTDNLKPNDMKNRISGYFSKRDFLFMIVLAIMAFLTSNYGLKYLLPGGTAPGFVHGFLKLPGPGAGIFISCAFICFWLVLGLLLTKKPGTALGVAIITVIIQLLFSFAMGQPNRFQILLIAVGIIIEVIGLLPLEKKPLKYFFPALLCLMGLVTLGLMLTGNAKMGESGAAATVFPLGYAISGILALFFAVISYKFPVKYILGAGVSQMFYITYCWLFNGKKGFATWVPVTPAIPALLTFSFVCGAFMAGIAYGFYLLLETYNTDNANDKIS